MPPSPVLPGVPTIAESGLPNYRADNWFGLGAAAGTPQEVIDRLNAEVEQAREGPRPSPSDCVSLGFQPTGGSVEEMKQAIQRDRAKWKAVIDAQGIRAE